MARGHFCSLRGERCTNTPRENLWQSVQGGSGCRSEVGRVYVKRGWSYVGAGRSWGLVLFKGSLWLGVLVPASSGWGTVLLARGFQFCLSPQTELLRTSIKEKKEKKKAQRRCKEMPTIITGESHGKIPFLKAFTPDWVSGVPAQQLSKSYVPKMCVWESCSESCQFTSYST